MYHDTEALRKELLDEAYAEELEEIARRYRK